MVQSVYKKVARPVMTAKYVIQRVNKAVILSLLQNHRACIEKGNSKCDNGLATPLLFGSCLFNCRPHTVSESCTTHMYTCLGVWHDGLPCL